LVKKEDANVQEYGTGEALNVPDDRRRGAQIRNDPVGIGIAILAKALGSLSRAGDAWQAGRGGPARMRGSLYLGHATRAGPSGVGVATR